MKKNQLKANKVECKARYKADPSAAIQTLKAQGTLDFDNLSCVISYPTFLNPTGLHRSGGGDGSFACPVEIMLAGLVSCAGVTLTAVASSMQLTIRKGSVIAEGVMDFRGTLAVDKAAPIGLTEIRLKFNLDTDEEVEKIEKLLELTHRYCVVHRTFDSPPPILVSRV